MSVVLTTYSLSFGQGNFFVQNNNIDKWYAPATANAQEMFARAASNSDFQEVLNTYHVSFSDVSEYFHLIDFDNNGRLDVIFNGKIKHADYVFLFLNKGEAFHLSFMGKGVLYKTNEPDGDNCLNFSLYEYACCGNFINKNIQYACIRTNNTVYFNTVSTDLIFKSTFLPNKRITPTPFHVKTVAYLRIEPMVDNERYIAGKTRWKGNMVAVYPKDANGTIYAETRDREGKFWYFVRMENISDISIHSDRFVALKETDAEGCSYYGWVQHDEIEFDKE